MLAAHVALYTRPAAPHMHGSDGHQRNSTRPQGLRCWPNIYTAERKKDPAKRPANNFHHIQHRACCTKCFYMMLTNTGLAIQKFRVDGRDHLYYICTLLYNIRSGHETDKCWSAQSFVLFGWLGFINWSLIRKHERLMMNWSDFRLISMANY